VPQEATSISYGVLLWTGQIWFKDVNFEIVPIVFKKLEE
jgi:hypothetical protein